MSASAPILAVDTLSVTFGSGAEAVEAVRGVSFTLAKGETLALVGESGSGKSVTALSILQLLPYPRAHHPSGSIRLDGTELVGAPEPVLRAVRGAKVSMVFQEPMTSLNPLHTIGKQVAEVLELHQGLRGEVLRGRVLEMLALVGIPDAESRLGALPHELSGGQRQRVMIAMALANQPDLLIADEPTTALDVTIQAQILTLLKELQARFGMAMLFITHDLGIVRKIADRVCVMTGGEIVETGPVEQVFTAPVHPYTRKLLAAEPGGHPLIPAADAPDVIAADDIKVWFPRKGGLFGRTTGYLKAVDGVSVRVRRGQTVGIVGESGSGKTTLGLALLRLLKSEGAIRFEGCPIERMSAADLRPLRRGMQMVFQDPYGSLSPRLSVEEIVGEGLEVHRLAATRAERRRLIDEALDEVGLDPAFADRYPHEFSGGQRQRIAIARAIVLKPAFIVLDEPTSALDVSVQSQIVTLLRELQARHSIAYLFISHDLRVVRALADHLVVMKDGKVVESGPAEQLFSAPSTAYTRALMAAALNLEVAPTGVAAG
ncbi:ABC transporter ATP-binding protein [Magnetospirillum fulvum]|uniref:ABC transporter, duplicated ATPase component n=1 Tax=Magnetospirillum fulvum MGU-K5 TaxID=1316936 RepID=S9SFN9_MAGFU|nr:ABC transporter ATP-binding protein [Magnetospirillum fulvum]EPY02903.1 ABC transporter, duplicated ATPase component [Magnetospirillum fulvum MGU-K5]